MIGADTKQGETLHICSLASLTRPVLPARALSHPHCFRRSLRGASHGSGTSRAVWRMGRAKRLPASFVPSKAASTREGPLGSSRVFFSSSGILTKPCPCARRGRPRTVPLDSLPPQPPAPHGSAYCPSSRRSSRPGAIELRNKTPFAARFCARV